MIHRLTLRYFTYTLLAGVLIFIDTHSYAQPIKNQDATGIVYEKCYGIVKKGKADCSLKENTCGETASGLPIKEEWILVPKGLCIKIMGARKQPR